MNPINITDLTLETHHAGKVLTVRTFGTARRIQSVQNAIEDGKGNVDRLALYNGDPKLDRNAVLPKGAIFAIKEPFYKATVDGGYIVRVDHPSDLIQLRASHHMVPSGLSTSPENQYNDALGWKVKGNNAYKHRQYIDAVEFYTLGISKCFSTEKLLELDLYRNRSIANLYLQRYEAASADALNALIPDEASDDMNHKNNAKAYYRAGCAEYHLGRYNEAHAHFAASLKIVLEDDDTLRELNRTSRRIGEEQLGNHNFDEMADSVNSKHYRLDHASYLAKVAVRSAGTKGRGLFALEDIKAGELVLCEKAFSVAFASDAEAETYVVLNLNTNYGAIGAHANLLFGLVQKMTHNSREAARFLDLYAGGYSPKCTGQVVDGVTALDTFHVQAIVEHNAFGCATSGYTEKEETTKVISESSSSAGIWIVASYANHACDGNVSRSFIGDFMIVRACRNIAKDEEILMPYRSPDADFSETQKYLQKSWKFKCECEICTAEEKSETIQRRHRQGLIKESKTLLNTYTLSTTFQPDRATITKAEKLYGKLEATYDKKLFEYVPRLGLVELGRWLCTAYHTGFMPNKVIDTAQRILHNLGYGVSIVGKVLHIDRAHCKLDSAAIDAAMYAAHAYISHGDSEIGKQFEDFAKEMYIVMHGHLRGFASRYGGS